MKKFTYNNKEYETGIYHDSGMAYPCVYVLKKILWWTYKERVWTRSDIMWTSASAVNSFPETIEYHDSQVMLMFIRFKEAWK